MRVGSRGGGGGGDRNSSLLPQLLIFFPGHLGGGGRDIAPLSSLPGYALAIKNFNTPQELKLASFHELAR